MPWSIESAVISSWHDHYRLGAENAELLLIEQHECASKFPLFSKKGNELIVDISNYKNKQTAEREKMWWMHGLDSNIHDKRIMG